MYILYVWPKAVLFPAESLTPTGVVATTSLFKSDISPEVEVSQYISKTDLVGIVSKTPRSWKADSMSALLLYVGVTPILKSVSILALNGSWLGNYTY